MGLNAIPIIVAGWLTPAQRRALAIADNKLALNSDWNEIVLAEEFKFLSQPEIALEGFTGFETLEIDSLLDQLEPTSDSDTEAVPEVAQAAVSQTGNVWVMGDHRLICGDAKDADLYSSLMGDEKARMVMADAPFNTRIDGRVSGLGRVRHREFAKASGEMTPAEFIQFLIVIMTLVGERCIAGAISYWFMDWAHMPEMLAAIKGAGLDHK